MTTPWAPDPDIRKGRSVVYHLHPLGLHHEIPAWALTDPILTRIEEIMRAVRVEFGAELRDFNGETNHVHLLVHHPPAVAVSKLANSSKASRPATCARNTAVTCANT